MWSKGSDTDTFCKW